MREHDGAHAAAPKQLEDGSTLGHAYNRGASTPCYYYYTAVLLTYFSIHLLKELLLGVASVGRTCRLLMSTK